MISKETIRSLESARPQMDNHQFDRLLREFIANQWRMFWCQVCITAAGSVILCTTFYGISRNDLSTLMNKLDTVERQTFYGRPLEEKRSAP